MGRSGVYARPSKKAKVAEEGKAQLFEPVRSGMACCLRQEKMLKQALCQRSRGKLSILSRRLPEQCCALLAFSSFLACSKAELSKKSVAALGCFLSTNAHRAESRPQVTESRAKAACFTRTGFRSPSSEPFLSSVDLLVPYGAGPDGRRSFWNASPKPRLWVFRLELQPSLHS